MSEEKIVSILRQFNEALAKRDTEGVLSFFAEDAEWNTPDGIFKGMGELKGYLTRAARETPDLVIEDAGIGIVMLGDKAVYEQLQRGTTKGLHWEAPVISVYELSDGKIQCIRTVYDRLSAGRPPSKGWLSAIVENVVAGQVRGGLGRYM